MTNANNNTSTVMAMTTAAEVEVQVKVKGGTGQEVEGQEDQEVKEVQTAGTPTEEMGSGNGSGNGNGNKSDGRRTTTNTSTNINTDTRTNMSSDDVRKWTWTGTNTKRGERATTREKTKGMNMNMKLIHSGSSGRGSMSVTSSSGSGSGSGSKSSSSMDTHTHTHTHTHNGNNHGNDDGESERKSERERDIESVKDGTKESESSNDNDNENDDGNENETKQKQEHKEEHEKEHSEEKEDSNSNSFMTSQMDVVVPTCTPHSHPNPNLNPNPNSGPIEDRERERGQGQQHEEDKNSGNETMQEQELEHEHEHEQELVPGTKEEEYETTQEEGSVNVSVNLWNTPTRARSTITSTFTATSTSNMQSTSTSTSKSNPRSNSRSNSEQDQHDQETQTHPLEKIHDPHPHDHDHANHPNHHDASPSTSPRQNQSPSQSASTSQSPSKSTSKSLQSESLHSVYEDGMRILQQVMQEVQELEVDSNANASGNSNSNINVHILTSSASMASSIGYDDGNEDGLSRELSSVKESPISIAPLSFQREGGDEEKDKSKVEDVGGDYFQDDDGAFLRSSNSWRSDIDGNGNSDDSGNGNDNGNGGPDSIQEGKEDSNGNDDDDSTSTSPVHLPWNKYWKGASESQQQLQQSQQLQLPHTPPKGTTPAAKVAVGMAAEVVRTTTPFTTPGRKACQGIMSGFASGNGNGLASGSGSGSGSGGESASPSPISGPYEYTYTPGPGLGATRSPWGNKHLLRHLEEIDSPSIGLDIGVGGSVSGGGGSHGHSPHHGRIHRHGHGRIHGHGHGRSHGLSHSHDDPSSPSSTTTGYVSSLTHSNSTSHVSLSTCASPSQSPLKQAVGYHNYGNGNPYQHPRHGQGQGHGHGNHHHHMEFLTNNANTMFLTPNVNDQMVRTMAMTMTQQGQQQQTQSSSSSSSSKRRGRMEIGMGMGMGMGMGTDSGIDSSAYDPHASAMAMAGSHTETNTDADADTGTNTNYKPDGNPNADPNPNILNSSSSAIVHTNANANTNMNEHAHIDIHTHTILTWKNLRDIYGCHSRKDAMKLALRQSIALSDASSDLVDVLLQYLETYCGARIRIQGEGRARGNGRGSGSGSGRGSGREHTSSSSSFSKRGLSLPAAAIGWLASHIYPDEADELFHQQWEGAGSGPGSVVGAGVGVGVGARTPIAREQQRDEHERDESHESHSNASRLPHASPSAMIRDRLSLLKVLLAKHVTHLRITRDPWPPNSNSNRTKNPPRRTIRRNEHEYEDEHDMIHDTPRRRGRMLLNFDAASTSSFLSYHRQLQHRPRIDMRLFPNASYLQADGIPPDWFQNLHVTNETLTRLTFQRACMMDVPSFFFGVAPDQVSDPDLVPVSAWKGHDQVDSRDEGLILPPPILSNASSPSPSPPSPPLGGGGRDDHIIHGFGDIVTGGVNGGTDLPPSPSPIKREYDHDALSYHGGGDLAALTSTGTIGGGGGDKNDNVVQFPHLEHLCLSRCCIGESSGMRNITDSAGGSDRRQHLETDSSSQPRATKGDIASTSQFQSHHGNHHHHKSILSRFKGLVTLDLSHNELVHAESALAGLGDLPRLSAINLSHNRLQSLNMNSSQMMLGNVSMLLLANNCLTNVRGLERLYSLKKLDLRNNKISNLCDISALANLPDLMELDVVGNPLVLKGKRRFRVQMFNLFKESRMDVHDRSLTYRELRALLPQLDGSTISKKELVMLKYLSYAHTAPPITSQDVIPEETESGDGAGHADSGIGDEEDEALRPQEEQITRQESTGSPRPLTGPMAMKKKGSVVHRRRVTRKAPRTTAVISDRNIHDKKEVHQHRAKPVKYSKVKLKRQKLRPMQLGVTLSLEEVVKSIRPYVAPTVVDNDDDENTSSETGESNHDSENDVDVGVDQDQTGEIAHETDELNDKSDELNQNSGIDSEKISASDNDEGIDSGKSKESDLDNGVPDGENPGNDLAPVDSEEKVPASHIDTEGSCDISLCSSNSTALVANITRDVVSDDCSHSSQQGSRSDEAFSNDDSCQQLSQDSSDFEPSDLGSFKPVLERIDFAANERSATFDGPESYSNLSVAAYFELYCRSYVFPSSSHDDSFDLYTNDQVQENALPRIQLYQTDRDLMLWTIQQGEDRSGISPQLLMHHGHNQSSERLVAVSKEYILPCGIAATARVQPKDTVVKGFRGNDLFDAGSKNPFTMSDYQALLICISNAALYIIPNFTNDDAGSAADGAEHRRFPSPISSRATFQDALWPHAFCRHPLKFLRKISFDGFGFQRLTLHFKLPGLRDEVYVQPENGMMSMFDYSYVIFTCNQKRTIQLIQSLQQAAKEASPIVGGVSIGSVLVENDDNAIVEAVGKALSRPNFSDDILHYQILHQTWSTSLQEHQQGEGAAALARRCLVLTNHELFLFNETYAGDLSACAVDLVDMSSVRYGDISMRTIASANVEDVTDASISKEDPKFVTLGIKSQSRLRWSSVPWLLKCRDRENAERLVHDVRKLCCM